MMTPIRPRRSALYMPGANDRALEKARGLDADVLILDLEDAVAPEKKAEAREKIAAALAAGGYDGREIVIRTNGVGTEYFIDDLKLALVARPDAILVPKVESAAMVSDVRAEMADLGVTCPIWAMIETPLAILNLPEISKASADAQRPLACFVVGTNDLVKDTGVRLGPDRAEGLYWLTATVTAGKAYGVAVLDGVYNDFKNAEGFERECRQGRALGMDGKTLIHPTQIATTNAVFAPDADAVAWSRQVIAAFDAPENQGKGVINIDGRMVELLHAEMARREVAIADAIAAKRAETA